MDLADDITYSTHDLEDFYRAGLIPLHHLWPKEVGGSLSVEAESFIDKVTSFREVDRSAVERVFRQHAQFFVPITEPYLGPQKQKARLRVIFSNIIH